MADQEPTTAVQRFECVEVLVEDVDGRSAFRHRCVEESADVGQTHVGTTEQSDQPGGVELIGGVVAVAVGRVDGRRAEQADVVVDAQRLGGESSETTELADGEQPICRVLGCHLGDTAPSPRVKVNSSVDRVRPVGCVTHLGVGYAIEHE